jgi:DNA-binding XRE family transcriptional regulator
MQAVVKTPRIEINIKGDIPHKLLTVLTDEYGEDIKIYEDEDDDEKINIFETDWYKKTKARMSPGDYLRNYREIRGMTQQELGNLLGGIPRQHVSNMERGIRSISLKTAQKLAQIFEVSVEKFL